MPATDYDFIQTRTEIIERAFRIVGAFSLGDVLSAEKSAQAVQALNSLVKAWQNEYHVFLWTEKKLEQLCSVGDPSYDVPLTTPFLWLERAYLRKAGETEENRIELISWARYTDIPNKDDPGSPEQVCIQHWSGGSTIYAYPTPNAADYLVLYGPAPLFDLDSAGGSGDMLSRFQMALTFGLAHQLSHEYGLPLAERQLLKSQEAEYLHKAKASDHDREDFTFVQGAF